LKALPGGLTEGSFEKGELTMLHLPRSGSIVVVSALLILAVSCPAEAALIQYQFSGNVVAITDLGPLQGLVHLNDPYTATFVLNTATPDEFPDPDRAGYSGLSASLVMQYINVDAHARLDVANSPTLDFIYFSTTDAGLAFDITLNDATATALTCDTIPTPFPTFAGYPRSALGVFWDPGPSKFSASIDSVTVTTLPEPGTLSLILLGIVGGRQRVPRCASGGGRNRLGH
jgi:hypothetical protein